MNPVMEEFAAEVPTATQQWLYLWGFQRHIPQGFMVYATNLLHVELDSLGTYMILT